MHLKLCLLACLTPIALSFQAFSSEESAPNTVLIALIESMTVRVLESAPEQITLEAHGIASTGGWTKPQLRKKEDKDGVCIFEFVAQPPTGIATQALSKIEAAITFPKPAGIREVRVVSKRNTKSEKIK